MLQTRTAGVGTWGRARLFALLWSSVGAAAMAGCGDDADGAATSGVSSDGGMVDASHAQSDGQKQGRLVGAVVSGLAYSTATTSGTTDRTGHFSYLEGEQVSFSVGELSLGSVQGKGKITLADLVAEDDSPDDQRTNNLLSLLLSLDSDGDLNTGIEISTQTSDIVSQHKDDIDFDQKPVDFAKASGVSELFTALNAAKVFEKDTDPRPRALRGAESTAAYLQRAVSKRKVVKTAYGEVSGYAANSKMNQWLGVPYGRAPLGDLRWKPTQEPEAWEQTRDAVDWADQAAQDPALQAVGEGGMSEDCLYLNVTAPADAKDLPVMVWFHGGAFTILSGNSKGYNNVDSLTTKGVVLVTVNHRLGPFGYFAHPWLAEESEYGGSGNYGQMDLVQALKWVKKNIAGFGGDASNVTIFGQSGGCGKVTALMMSPMATGLFHQAICQSGNTSIEDTTPESVIEANEAVGKDLFSRLGVKSLEEARALNWIEVIQSDVDANIQRQVYRPNVDNHYLPKTYYATMLEGQPSDVPLMLGATSGDYPTLRSGLVDVVPFRKQHSKSDMFVYKFGRVPMGWADRGVSCGHGGELPYQFNYPPMFVENYRLNLVADAAGMKPEIGDLDGDGVTGTDGDADDVLADMGWNDDDDKFADILMTVSTTFAKTGKPSAADLDWPAYTNDNDTYVEFGQSKVEVKTGLAEAFPMSPGM